MTVDVQGSGTGGVTYQINDEPAVTGAGCTVEGLEDDTSGVLQLAFGFTDASHGPVGVMVSVTGYSTDTTRYQDLDSLDILVTMGDGPSWSSGTGSSVLLGVIATPAGSGCRYNGSFVASNLAALGGAANALAIKFAQYDVTLQPQEEWT
jgi:hypothetical protein